MLGTGGESLILYQLVIGIGAWLGTIMLFNVWVLIWPSQKKVLGLVPATDKQKAAARKTTLYAMRANLVHPYCGACRAQAMAAGICSAPRGLRLTPSALLKRS